MQKRGKKKLAQASMEYLMVAGLAFVIIVPMVYMFYTYSTEISKEVTESKVSRIASSLVDAAEEVFYLGEPSKSTVKFDMPVGVFDVLISPDKRELIFYVGDANKYTEIMAPSNVNLVSYLVPEDMSAGQQSYKVEAKSDHALIYTGDIATARPKWCAYYIASQITRNARPVYADKISRAGRLYMPILECTILDVYLPDLNKIMTMIDIEGTPTGFSRQSNVPVRENDMAIPPPIGGTIDTTQAEAVYDFLYIKSNPPIVTINSPICRDDDFDSYGHVMGSTKCGELYDSSEYNKLDCVDDPLTQYANPAIDLDGDGNYAEHINPGATEVCNDGADNNCDNIMDCADPICIGTGNCPCINDAVQDCYSGDPSTKDVGICHAGKQTCSAGAWGVCTDEQLPQTEICNDNQDNDCDGKRDCADTDCTARTTSRITDNIATSMIPSLAWTGSEYGVAWHDNRDGGAHEIYFARIRADGTKIGSDVRITIHGGYSRYTSLAWTGSEYGVAWYDIWSAGDSKPEIYFARIRADGTKIGSDVRITTSNGNSVTDLRSLVWTGSEYGVAWQDDRDGNNEIYFARIGADGNEIADSEVRITNDGADSRYPSLVWTGSEYGVAWYDDRETGNYEIYFARIGADGNEIDGSEVRITDNAAHSVGPSLAWNDINNQYGVAWYDNRQGNDEIYFARIGADGTKDGGDVRITDTPTNSRGPSLMWAGSEYGVAWYDGGEGDEEIYLARISADGTKIGEDARITNAPEYSRYPSIAWTGSGYGVAWQDFRDGNEEIYFADICS